MQLAEQFQKQFKKSHVALVGLAGKKVSTLMKKCDVTEMTVYNWINGKTPINPKHIKAIEKVYGIKKG